LNKKHLEKQRFDFERRYYEGYVPICAQDDVFQIFQSGYVMTDA